MLGLFFDVVPKPGHMVHYFEHVDRLKLVLASHEGLFYLERFRPLDAPDALLSHQHWRRRGGAGGLAAGGDAPGEPGRRAARAFRGLPHPRGARGCGRGGGAAGRDHRGRCALRQWTRVRERHDAGAFPDAVEAGRAREAREIAAHAARNGAGAVHVFAISRDYTLTDRAEAPD
jgi:hypothetical protein